MRHPCDKMGAEAGDIWGRSALKVLTGILMRCNFPWLVMLMVGEAQAGRGESSVSCMKKDSVECTWRFWTRDRAYPSPSSAASQRGYVVGCTSIRVRVSKGGCNPDHDATVREER